MALLRRRNKVEIKTSGLKRREVIPEGPIVRPSFKNLWGGFLLDVPNYCPNRCIIETNTRVGVPAVEPILCETNCKREMRGKCPAYNWLSKTQKTRIRIQREGS